MLVDFYDAQIIRGFYSNAGSILHAGTINHEARCFVKISSASLGQESPSVTYINMAFRF